MKKSCFKSLALLALLCFAFVEARDAGQNKAPAPVKKTTEQPCAEGVGAPATFSGKSFSYVLEGKSGCCNSLCDSFCMAGTLNFGYECSQTFAGNGFLTLNGCQSTCFSLQCSFCNNDCTDMTFADCQLYPDDTCFPVPDCGYYSLRLGLVKTCTNQGVIPMVFVPQPDTIPCCDEIFSAVHACGQADFAGW